MSSRRAQRLLPYLSRNRRLPKKASREKIPASIRVGKATRLRLARCLGMACRIAIRREPSLADTGRWSILGRLAANKSGGRRLNEQYLTKVFRSSLDAHAVGPSPADASGSRSSD